MKKELVVLVVLLVGVCADHVLFSGVSSKVVKDMDLVGYEAFENLGELKGRTVEYNLTQLEYLRDTWKDGDVWKIALVDADQLIRVKFVKAPAFTSSKYLIPFQIQGHNAAKLKINGFLMINPEYGMAAWMQMDSQIFAVHPLIGSDSVAVMKEIIPSRYDFQESEPILPKVDEQVNLKETNVSAPLAETNIYILTFFSDQSLCDRTGYWHNFLLGDTAMVWANSQPEGSTPVIPYLQTICWADFTYQSSFTNDLYYFQSSSFVNNLRASQKADLVTLLEPASLSSRGCGIAFLPPTYPANAGTYGTGYSVTNAQCAYSQHTYAHELGHNFGMRHDRYVATTDPNLCYYGFYILDAPFSSPQDIVARTVMTYKNFCNDNQISPCDRAPTFSSVFDNTEATIYGMPCSATPTTNELTGRADNTVTFLDSAPGIAQYRTQL